MLELKVDDIELFDERTEEFVYVKGATLQLEHSLISISKWESKWHKAFLGREEKTDEELRDYIQCMILNKNVDPKIIQYLNNYHIAQVVSYIEEPMTATWFSKEEMKKSGMGREVITSELIYYWMIALNVPVEFQKWHLNRLLTLIRVCNIKNTPPKKMSQKELMNRNRALNEARKASMHTKG